MPELLYEDCQVVPLSSFGGVSFDTKVNDIVAHYHLTQLSLLHEIDNNETRVHARFNGVQQEVVIYHIDVPGLSVYCLTVEQKNDTVCFFIYRHGKEWRVALNILRMIDRTEMADNGVGFTERLVAGAQAAI